MFLLSVTSGVAAYVALARRHPTYVQAADQYITGPDVRCCCCCATRLSFVCSELSWEGFSKYCILCYVHSRDREQPNLSNFIGRGPTSRNSTHQHLPF
jgi:hypothetical protein